MELFASARFWLGLGEIAYLNLLLSGDNALAIALAVRGLPRRKRTLGQVWGAVGAVALRLLFLAVVMYLLEIPFLKLAGGVLLIWIAFKLVQSETGVEAEARRGASLWEAIGIIIVADVTMSLDNVLAIAAAARGDLLLIMFGIGLSLPIVVWGAGWLARLMNRHPWIVWLGGGILGKVAGEMVLEDPVVRDRLGSIVAPMPYALPAGGTLDVHPVPLALGLVLVVLGWWCAQRPRKKVPENV
jgi:YjbE family integral membrane protein